MNIWMLKAEESGPIITGEGRIGRVTLIANLLADRGHQVTWWSSTYLHTHKKYSYQNNHSLQIKDNLILQLLHSKHGYKKNISLKRIQYSRDLANKFRTLASKENKPDIIYCSWPLIDLAYEAVKYGQEHDIPVVVDIRDFWPDIFVQPFPKVLQPFVQLGVNLLFGKRVKYTLKNATTIVGVIPKALEFAEKHGRKLEPNDHVVYLAYDSSPSSSEEKEAADKFWEDLGVSANQCVVSYIGSICNRVGDFNTLIGAAQRCVDPLVKFVFCGIGSYFEEAKKRTEGLTNVVMPGYRNRAELQSLLKRSTFGLLAYRNTEDFIDSLPNKFGEYLSEGLIILTSLKGLSREILEREECGMYYSDADSLLESISQIRSKPNQLKAMAANGKRLFTEAFDASKVYTDFCVFLEDLANKEGAKKE